MPLELLLNDEIIPNPFEEDENKPMKNLSIHMDYDITEEERKESLAIYKELIKLSLDKKDKGFIGIPEHVIYNWLRGVPLFRGMEKVKKTNRSIYAQWGWYDQNWEYLATDSRAKEFHQRFSRVVGYKYLPILKCIKDEFALKF